MNIGGIGIYNETKIHFGYKEFREKKQKKMFFICHKIVEVS